jgi:hypothetical protein
MCLVKPEALKGRKTISSQQRRHHSLIESRLPKRRSSLDSSRPYFRIPIKTDHQEILETSARKLRNRALLKSDHQLSRTKWENELTNLRDDISLLLRSSQEYSWNHESINISSLRD